MFQRKLMVVMCAVALLVLSAGVSEASLSRVEGMGLGSVPYLSQFTDDYVNIYPYPTSVVRQNNLVLAELGANPSGDVNEVEFNDQSLTLIKNFPSFGALAFDMKQTSLHTSFPANLTHSQWDVIWGKGFQKMDLAVRLDVTNSSFEHTDNTGGVVTHFEAHGSGFAPDDPYPFGLFFAQNAITATGIELNTFGVTPAIALHMSNDNRVEAAVTFRRYSLDRNASVGGVAGESWQDNGNLSYSVNIRGIMNQGDRSTWYPAFWYVNDDLGYEVSGLGAGVENREVDETYKNVGLGLSHNMRVNDNNLLIFGVAGWMQKASFDRNDQNDGVANGQVRSAESKTTMAPLFFASLETEATSWLKVRMGATQAMMTTKDEETAFDTDSFTEKEKTSDFNFNLGAGIKWNNLDFDLTLNEAFPLSGGYILSGDQETPATRASATYHF